MHKEKFQFGNVGDTELEESIRHQEACFLVGTITNLDVLGGTLKMPTEATIHTMGLPPGLL
eukprot:28412-Hanusia_phi.AAC.19